MLLRLMLDMLRKRDARNRRAVEDPLNLSQLLSRDVLLQDRF